MDRNDTAAFKQTLQQIKAVGIQLRAITSDGWPAILSAVREELEGLAASAQAGLAAIRQPKTFGGNSTRR